MPNPVRIATRASRLALWQADHVAGLVRLAAPHLITKIVHVATTGDRDQSERLSSFGGVGVFTREVQKAVLALDADIAVHSLKDLPTEATAGLVLAAVPEHGQIADALVLPQSQPACSGLGGLPPGARLGTGSVRRQAQLWHLRRDFRMLEVRGNVETRLKKLDAGGYDGLILAVAGLNRLGLAGRVSAELSPPLMYPAAGQGALGIECRQDDADTRALLAGLDDSVTHSRVTAERSLLGHLRAGCHAPVGAATRFEGDQLLLEAVVLNCDGSERLFASGCGSADKADALGREVAERLLAQGADRLISQAPHPSSEPGV